MSPQRPTDSTIDFHPFTYDFENWQPHGWNTPDARLFLRHIAVCASCFIYHTPTILAKISMAARDKYDDHEDILNEVSAHIKNFTDVLADVFLDIATQSDTLSEEEYTAFHTHLSLSLASGITVLLNQHEDATTDLDHHLHA